MRQFQNNDRAGGIIVSMGITCQEVTKCDHSLVGIRDKMKKKPENIQYGKEKRKSAFEDVSYKPFSRILLFRFMLSFSPCHAPSCRIVDYYFGVYDSSLSASYAH